LDILNDYMREVYNRLIKKLQVMMDYLVAGNHDEIEHELKNLLIIEEESIQIKKGLLDELSEAETMLNRDDLMRLVMSVAHLADSATGLGYRIQAASVWKPDLVSIEKMKSMMENVDTSIKLIKEAIFILTKNAAKAIEISKSIEAIERNVDKLQRDFVQHIYDQDLDFKTTLRIRDFIIRLEEISDIAANTADAVRILAVRRFGVPR